MPRRGASLLDDDFIGENGLINKRLFDPDKTPMYASIRKQYLIYYDEELQISQLCRARATSNKITINRSTLVIHIFGDCRKAKTSSTFTGWAVFFGENDERPSGWNYQDRLRQDAEQTAWAATIKALTEALCCTETITQEYPEIKDVRIASESRELVDIMTVKIWDWVEDYDIDSEVDPVRYFNILAITHARLEHFLEEGYNVKFWHISSERNEGARAMVNSVLGNQALPRSSLAV
ncbi:hypothetical protein F4776DRAFT_619410 [Hypoxylon sp. NC0597]|nr:hypothetical protein F4776DRAFT_619410 [Hypoxylon sp. NC0597]